MVDFHQLNDLLAIVLLILQNQDNFGQPVVSEPGSSLAVMGCRTSIFNQTIN
jgi:hypothetical protein